MFILAILSYLNDGIDGVAGYRQRHYNRIVGIHDTLKDSTNLMADTGCRNVKADSKDMAEPVS